jgi:vitamin B12 transporter
VDVRRQLDHSRFGSEWTFGVNGSVGIVADWRVRASYGEGFKVPTLFQLYSNYGNEALVPERSRSVDLAVEKGDRNAPLHVALTVFRRDSRDLIDYVSCWKITTGICAGRPYGTYDNVGKARAEGIEAELGAKISERFRAGAAYTYVKAINRTAGDPRQGNDLARRPRHALTVSADWTTPLAGLALGADLRMVGDSFDDAYGSSRIDGHALVTLRAAVPVAGAVELYGRIENLTDQRYETATGYGVPGRSAYVGVRGRF